MSWTRFLVLIGAIVMVSCGSTATGTTSSNATDSTATDTTSSTEVETTVAPTSVVASPSTSEASDVAADDVDPALGRNSETWQEYTSLVSPREALRCLTAGRERRGPYQFELLPDDLLEATFTIFDGLPPTASDETVAEAFDGFEQVALVSEVDTWIDLQIAIFRLAVEANKDVPEQSTEAIRRYEVLLLDLAAEADRVGPSGEIDIGQFLRPLRAELLSAFDAPPSCPLDNQARIVGPAMGAFESDNESFGGRGLAAGYRCLASAMVDLMLSEFIESDSPTQLLEPTSAALTLTSGFWWDRSPDAESVAVRDAWTSLVDDIDGEPTPEQMDAARDVLAQWRAYRDTLPEGFILCPLDPGWAP